MAPRPEEAARYTVEQNGGEYVTDVPNLLALFKRKQLTDRARREIRDALHRQGVGTEPDLLAIHRADAVRLFLLERQPAATTWTAGTPPPIVDAGASLVHRLRPRTWKGWTAYGFATLFVVAALTGDSEEPPSPNSAPAAEEVEPADDTPASETRAAKRRAQRAIQRERLAQARLRRERAQARRERARIRRARAARREREERERREVEPAPVVPEPEPAASCHPSYDPCLNPNASDYDCAGGSGDGPEYTGFVTVKGPDDYGLDNDGDGTGCE